ncbi:MAG: F0F1 ATP synthase subunit epsilon [Comamonadaceae bacterium]|nr:F0F1 ATP synthase subunit epsilon [Comamonadaceae bacterium]
MATCHHPRRRRQRRGEHLLRRGGVRRRCPASTGELGIYPRHTPLITRIKPGAVRIKRAGNGEEEFVFVAGRHPRGAAARASPCSPTPRSAATDLDEKSALEAKRAAEEAMQNKTSAEEIATAEAELALAMAQIEAIRKLRNRA